MTAVLGILGTVAATTIGTVLIISRFAAMASRLHEALKQAMLFIEQKAEIQRQLDDEKRAREDRDKTLDQVQGELRGEREARKHVEAALAEMLQQTHPADVASAISRELERLRKLSQVPAAPTP